MGAVLVRALVWIKTFLQNAWPAIASWLGITIARQAAKAPIRVAIMTAYGIFLAVVFTGLAGMGVTSVVSQNPFNGVPANIMFLVCSAFPIHYAFGLFLAYVFFKITLLAALRTMNQVVMWLFGA